MHIYWGTIPTSCLWVSEDDSFFNIKASGCVSLIYTICCLLILLNLIVANVTGSPKFQISFCLKECKCFKNQHCALAVSVGSWCLFFGLGQLGNPLFFFS